MDSQQPTSFVRSRLPWVVLLAALGLYLITLNRWVSLGSLSFLSVFTDPLAKTPVWSPLLYLVTQPFHLLPPSAEVLGLNAVSAVLASLTLALLARSVALLPHDRTREERHRESGEYSLLSTPTAWIPPLAATLLLGLQASFWENATAATGEMLDLLLLAYVVRCLLEHRIDERNVWLYKLAFVYGLATTNNWGMIGYFPLMLGALVWVKGLGILDFRLLLRLLLFGIAGLLLYLLLPLISTITGDASISFWEMLRTQLVLQKQGLASMPRHIVWFGLLLSVLPLFLIGIRWPSTFGDTSAIGNILTNYAFRVVYALFLAFGLWGFADALYSPRAIVARYIEQQPELIVGPPMLSFYYLGALAMGYFIGYFLLVLVRTESRSRRRHSEGAVLAAQASLALVLAGVVAGIGFLAWRNYSLMRINNGRLYLDFARLCVEQLPAKGALVLSDQAYIQNIVQIYLNERGAGRNHLLVNTRLLAWPNYQRELHRRAPHLWTDPLPKKDLNPNITFTPAFLLVQMANVGATNQTYYLHPSFGYFFEAFQPEPLGLISRLRPYRTNELLPPPLPAEVVARGNDFWSGQRERLQTLLPGIRSKATDARQVGRWYSQCLNAFGVALQRQSPEAKWAEPAGYFEWARQLNPDNVIAEINLGYNQGRRAGKVIRSDSARIAEERFGSKFRGWDDTTRVNGPVDEPALCYELGRMFSDQTQPRQSITELSRSIALEADNLPVRFALARTLASVNLHERVLEATREITTRSAGSALPQEQQLELARLESFAWLGRGQPETGERILKDALRRFPGLPALVAITVDYYLNSDRPPQALALLDQQLQQFPDSLPLRLQKAFLCLRLSRHEETAATLQQIFKVSRDNPDALLCQGVLYIQTKNYTNALQTLDRLLALKPDSQSALLNRAIARLQSNQLEAAKKDYDELLKLYPHECAIHYGLAEIAWRRNDKAAAARHYEAYLQFAPDVSDEVLEVRKRLQSIQPQSK